MFLVINTFKITSKQLVGIEPAPPVAISDSAVIHLSEAIKFRTVSYSDLSMIDSAQFQKFIDYASQTYPLIHSQLKLEKVNSYALLYEWKGKIRH